MSILYCVVLIGQPVKNYVTIRSTNIQIRASLNNSPLAWATDTVSITLDRQTGEFKAEILVDDLHFATANPDFTGDTGENTGKYLTLEGIIPMNEARNNSNNAIDRQVEITAAFNDYEYRSFFTFTILKLQTVGFSVMANGTISHNALGINNLHELDDDLVIILSFTGY